MINEHKLPLHFRAEAVNTACYVMNRVMIRPLLNKTPYELWFDNKPNIAYFKVFGCTCYILNTGDQLGKFEAKADEGIFKGYSSRSKAYRVYNKRTKTIVESINVKFDKGIDNQETSKSNVEEEKEKDEYEEPKETDDIREIVITPELQRNLDPAKLKYKADHPPELVIGNPIARKV